MKRIFVFIALAMILIMLPVPARADGAWKLITLVIPNPAGDIFGQWSSTPVTVTISTQEFQTKGGCETAAAYILDWQNEIGVGYGFNTQVQCIQD